MRVNPSPFSLKLGVNAKDTVRLPFSQRGWSWAVVGAVMGGLTALLIHLPAQWLAQALLKATLGQVQLQEVKGSVWQGSGKLVLTGEKAVAMPWLCLDEFIGKRACLLMLRIALNSISI